MNVRPYGEHAVLAEPDDAGSVLALADAAAGWDGVLEAVPAARTVLVVIDRPAALAGVRERLARFRPESHTGTGTRHEAVVIDVVYDGADLAGTAGELGLDPDGLVRRHAAGSYVVGFCGFAPGFAYLTGLDPELHVPRLAEPRTRVPAGAVAVAGEFTAVYPRASPGGWRLLGRTAATLWDPERDPPAVLGPGTPVTFRPVP